MLVANQCVSPFENMRKRQVLANTTDAGISCISQSVDDLCPSKEKEGLESRICIPIEEMPTKEFRSKHAKRANFNGWLPEEKVIYKNSNTKMPGGFRRHVYID